MNGESGQQDTSQDEANEKLRKQYTVKDKWDKWNIVLRPLVGIITGAVIGLLGYFGSNLLQERQANEINMRLYSELMNQREQAENELKSEMFRKIFDSFLSSEDGKDNQKLIEIKKELLQLELLTRNFHESIDVKPIFRKILFSIIDLKRPLIKKQKTLKDEGGLNDEMKLRKINRVMDNLKSIAGRIARKQLELLAQENNILEIEVPYSELCMDIRPNKDFKKQKCAEGKGHKVKKRLTINVSNGKSISRDFEVDIKYAYPEWGQVYLSVKASPIDSETIDCSEWKNKNKINNICKEFWVSHFDFPLVDNTYLSHQERYGVAMDGIDKERKVIRFVLAYFPSTYSGLKEKSFYHQKVLDHLENWDFVGN